MKVIFDCETTGLYADYGDEILQFSAIDEHENVLMNTYIRPILNKSWEGAERIHGISPEMVADAPTFDELRGEIQKIFDNADMLISYNGTFDIGFLEAGGIRINHNIPHNDVMLMFAPIYGEWNDYHGNYKWQKLSTCASYYGYEFDAHDSLEDVKATLYCWKKMKEAGA